MEKIVIDKESFLYPEKLKQIENPPIKLYGIGNELLLNKPAIAIVGSRDCTENGKKIAYSFAYELAKLGIIIISGLAKGIDKEAHKGAISAQNGSTIAVLPNGFNYIYPEENKSLFYEILNKGGLIITEYTENVRPESSKFLERNRIVSGISMGVLVVEAEYRSGTSVTAKLSKKFGRKVFCIPGDITSQKSVGTNHLIRKGAILVTNVKEILQEFPEDDLLSLKKEENSKQLEVPEVTEIPEEYRKIYKVIQKKQATIHEICRETKVPIAKIQGLLTLMEIEGYIEKLPGASYRVLV